MLSFTLEGETQPRT